MCIALASYRIDGGDSGPGDRPGGGAVSSERVPRRKFRRRRTVVRAARVPEPLPHDLRERQAPEHCYPLPMFPDFNMLSPFIYVYCITFRDDCRRCCI